MWERAFFVGLSFRRENSRALGSGLCMHWGLLQSGHEKRIQHRVMRLQATYRLSLIIAPNRSP